ncbi:hypothetical protein L596_022376 [Steinernema carpocapsae]|uniref:Uncharacterized protein n=1 Tax=Steinernema carpocapsae TaxID=34508 RepID=A0A4U5MLK8_STECR|nr:hypothetical protein L596_022376 [Steinernema carpocapsae]
MHSAIQISSTEPLGFTTSRVCFTTTLKVHFEKSGSYVLAESAYTISLFCVSPFKNSVHSSSLVSTMTLRNLLILASIFSLALANTLTADLPFMLFASDNITKMTASAPFCMFVASMPDPTYVNTSKIVFTSADSSISVKSLISEHPYYLYNMIPEFGMRCFETKELEIDYGGVFDDIDGTFAEWHSIIFYFIAKDKVEGPCKGKGAANLGGNINVMYWGSSEISASSECPAVILIPTNENGLFCSISEVVTQNSIDQIPESGVDVFLILSRKNSMNKTHFLSYK